MDTRRQPGRLPAPPLAPDRGWSWVILVASFFSSVIVDGVCFSFGIFLLEFLYEYEETKATTSWAGSVLNGMYMIMAPVAGALSSRYGCRPVAIAGSVLAAGGFFLSSFSPNIVLLIITYGVLGGIGFGLMYLPSLCMISFYFDKKRAFATGVATCGSGIGAFVFAPMCEALIREYGWKGAMVLVSAVVLHGVVLGMLYRPLRDSDMAKVRGRWRQRVMADILEDRIDLTEPNLIKSLPVDALVADDELRDVLERKGLLIPDNITNGTKAVKPVEKERLPLWKEILHSLRESVDLSLLRNPVLLIYGLSCILCMAGFFVPFIYLPDKVIGHGYDASRGALLVSILGITNTVGRVITGWISDRPWADCLIVNNVALILGGVATILCPFCDSFVLLAFYACIFGLAIAAFVSLRPIIVVDLLGLDHLTKALGIIVLCQGITSFVGAPFAGWLFDITQSYDLSFYVAGTTITLAGLICMPLRRLARYLQKKQSNKELYTFE